MRPTSSLGFPIALAALLASAPSALAGRDPSGNATLVATPTVIGETAVATLRGMPNGRFLLAGDRSPGPASSPRGPVCLGLTGSLRIFNDSIRGAGARLDAAGEYRMNLRIPNRMNLLGLAYYLQGFVRDGAVPGGIAKSNGLTLLVGSRQGSELLPTGLPLAKAGATANAILGGARTFVAGGGTGSLLSPLSVSTTEVFDSNTKDFLPGPSLSTARALHTATTLADGRVLIVGGLDAAGAAIMSAEIYDPASNTLSPTGSMAAPRAGHVAALLPGGRVLVAGGSSNWTDMTTTFGSILSSAEIWSPGTGLFTSAANSMRNPRLAGAAVPLLDGRVLVSGGFDGTNIFGTPTITARSDLFDGATNAFSGTGTMQDDRAVHALTRLSDGRVLATGGATGLFVSASSSAEVFNPASGTWSLTGAMASARAGHRADLLAQTGEVLVTGGLQGSLLSPTAIAGCELFGGAGFAPTGPLKEARGGHVSGVLPNGSVLVAGGAPDGQSSSSTAEIYVR